MLFSYLNVKFIVVVGINDVTFNNLTLIITFYVNDVILFYF